MVGWEARGHVAKGLGGCGGRAAERQRSGSVCAIQCQFGYKKNTFWHFWQFWVNLDSGQGKGPGCRNARGWGAKGHAAGGLGGCGGRAAERQRGQRALRPAQQTKNDELRHPVAIIILSPTPCPTNEKRRTPMACRQHYRPVANTMGIC